MMFRSLRPTRFCLLAFLVASAAAAQPTAETGPTATVISIAPLYLGPDTARTPLRTAAVNTVLRVLEDNGEWLRVEFQDPQYGRRTAYVQAKNVRLVPSAQQPMDLSVTDSAAPAIAVTPATTSVNSEVAPMEPAAVPAGLAPRVASPNAIYITPTSDNFEVYLSAAIVKKGVPVTVVARPEAAALVLKASAVDVQKQSTGSKFARCLFAYCAGIEDRGSTSVQLISGDTVVWSYSVNKGRGQKNRQSLAEAIAKHLKDEYFHRQ